MDLTLSPKGRFCHFGKWNWDGHDKCGYRYLLFLVIPDKKHGQFQMILKPRTSSLPTALTYNDLPKNHCVGNYDLLKILQPVNQSQNYNDLDFAVNG